MLALCVLLAVLGSSGAVPQPNSTRPVLNATRRSRCGGAGSAIDCEHETTYIQERWVGHQTPLGQAPPGGWPLVVIYHGWNLWNSEYCWYATPQVRSLPPPTPGPLLTDDGLGSAVLVRAVP